jgi:hypothetical protein
MTGKTDKIPADFADVQLCEAMGIDYWTLMSQPARHVELFTIYLQVRAKVEAEENKKLERQYGRQKTQNHYRGRR